MIFDKKITKLKNYNINKNFLKKFKFLRYIQCLSPKYNNNFKKIFFFIKV